MRLVVAALLASLWVAPVSSILNGATAREIANSPGEDLASGPEQRRPPCPNALPELKELAASGDAHAQVRLGDLHKRGCGRGMVRADDSAAERYYAKAAVQGHLEAQHKLGLLLYGNKDYGGAIAWFRRAAGRNHQDSIARLHAMYTLRHGVPDDDSSAVKWFRDAGRAGDAASLTQLGVMYQSGRGVAPNYDKALAFYRQAADAGDPRAQLKLGTVYRKGLGVRPDLVRALMWYIVAMSFDSVYADLGRARVKEVSSHMTAEQVAKAERLADDWMRDWRLNHAGS